MAWNYNRLDVGTPLTFMESWPAAGKSSGRLRIGYLSSDLREHAVGYLMTEVLGLHDRSKVEVFAYYCGPRASDPLHQHFQKSVDHWLSVSEMDDASAARRFADDGVQILVDLNGYTREARLKLVAMRPAPVIVNWPRLSGDDGQPVSSLHHRRRLDHSREQRNCITRRRSCGFRATSPAPATATLLSGLRAARWAFRKTQPSTAASTARTN